MRQQTLPGSRVRPPVPKESEIRGAVRDYLRMRGWFVWHNLQGLGCYPGLPDLTAVKDGRVLFIELKRPGGRQRPDQKVFQEDLERAGGTYLLVTGIDDIIAWDRMAS